MAVPLYHCSSIVVVRGFVPEATLDVEVAGTIVLNNVPGGFPEPTGAILTLPSALNTGDLVRARQQFAGAQSDWSAPVTVRDHTADFPAGPPRPEIDPGPVYKCGSRTGVANLLIGCNVWITAGGTEIGRVDGAVQHQGVNVTPDYGLGQQVRAWASMCGDPSPPSVLQVTQLPPLPLAAPTFETAYAGSQQVTLNGVANGARFTLSRNSVAVGTFRAWGGRFTVNGISPPVVAGDVFSAVQWLCPTDPPSPPGTSTAQPCSALPAPEVAPIQAGDTTVTLLSFVPDARIKVFASGAKVGDGSGPVVVLTRPIKHGETVDIFQSVGTCVSAWGQELQALCVAPHVGFDPSALDLFPVGFKEYDGGTTTVLGMTMHVRGNVFYPANDDGLDASFNDRLAGIGRVPVVFIVHGRHDDSVPNYKGYDYFQTQLARMGIVAVSVDENETYPRHSASNIHERAQLAIASIVHFQALDAGGDTTFGGRLDFARVGLMGHSRGGEAVVVIPEVPPPAGVTIKGVLSLAPVDFGASSGEPKGYAFMTILPAADGDVVGNDGAHFYDQAHLDPYRCQLYIHYANHNFFNRQWLNDDTGGGLPIMSRPDHERILSTYGCAFFRNVVLGHATTGFLRGTTLPPAVQTENVHISFEWGGVFRVDNHEDANGIALNSLSHPTSQLFGLSADEYPFAQFASSRYNDTFYGNTIGMVAEVRRSGGIFRSELDTARNLTGREIWIRAAEVYDGSSLPADPTGFELGIETTTGTRLWVDSDDVGGLPRPFDRGTFGDTKTMLKTLRFPLSCFATTKRTRVRAILIRMNRKEPRPLAFDDLDIVKP